jgi:hypothetical protein
MFVGGGPRQFRPISFERPLVRKGCGGFRHQSGCGRSARRRMTSLSGLEQPCAQCLPAECRSATRRRSVSIPPQACGSDPPHPVAFVEALWRTVGALGFWALALRSWSTVD